MSTGSADGDEEEYGDGEKYGDDEKYGDEEDGVETVIVSTEVDPAELRCGVSIGRSPDE